jgi:hypothetical protein
VNAATQDAARFARRLPGDDLSHRIPHERSRNFVRLAAEVSQRALAGLD